MSFKGLNPASDYMILKKHEKKSNIALPENVKVATNTIVFEIIKIGPGYWQNGIFIKTTHKPGDMVFIVGNIAELQYNDIVYVMGQERTIIAELES